MKRELYMLRISLLATLSLSASIATAGTVIETISKDLTGNQGDTSMTTYAQNGNLRVNGVSSDSFMIFKDDTIYSLNSEDKEYVALDRAAIKRIADQINPAMKQVQEQLAKMPPEQRAQIEKMMGGKMRGMGPKETQEIRKTARADKIAGFACKYVEIYEGGELTDEMCVAAPSAIAGSQELISTAARMSDLFKEMLGSLDAPWLKQLLDKQMHNYESLGGIPVLTRHYSDGKPALETTLKSSRTESIPVSMFEIPSDYKKKNLMSSSG